MRCPWWLAAAAALLAFPQSGRAAEAACAAPKRLAFEVSGKIQRSALGFTQGFEFHGGRLYESTGRIDGPTRVNVIDLAGKVTPIADLGASVFGEGLTILNDEIVQLTWQEHKVFVYDLAGKSLRTMRNPRLGWGLSNNGKELLFTDGEGALHYARPDNFAISRSVTIRTDRQRQVRGVNELEMVKGKLYGNVFTTDQIVRFDPATGCVDGVADLGLLRTRMTPSEKAQIAASEQYVLNGIAYDAAENIFYLTGKRWPVIFVGRFVEAP